MKKDENVQNLKINVAVLKWQKKKRRKNEINDSRSHKKIRSEIISLSFPDVASLGLARIMFGIKF